MSITKDLLHLISSYRSDRSLHIAVNGYTSAIFPVEASVPQESVLGSILGNIYFNDLLQSATSESAYADDCTLSMIYAREKLLNVVLSVNKQ